MKEFAPGSEMSEPGTIEYPIIDSQMTIEEALRANPDFFLAPEIFERQVVLKVVYLSFDGKYHQGQIVVDKDLEGDVKDFFNFLIEQNFPINKTVPIAHNKYNFDDTLSMGDNNSSGFNPRNIAGTEDKPRPSNHAFGRAIDLNPFQNPFIKNNNIEPKGAKYNIANPGTFSPDSPVVLFLKSRGWIWGGDYQEIKDYHHFEKPLKKAEQDLQQEN
jgi:hypothetical protein